MHRDREYIGGYGGLRGFIGVWGADGIGVHRGLGVYWELWWSGGLQVLGCIEMGTYMRVWRALLGFGALEGLGCISIGGYIGGY